MLPALLSFACPFCGDLHEADRGRPLCPLDPPVNHLTRVRTALPEGARGAHDRASSTLDFTVP